MGKSRLEELADIFETASKQPTNIIDPPFDCVTVNLRPETCAEISKNLRAMQTLANQAAKPFVGRGGRRGA